jgi:TnpA family transposase
LKEKEKRDKKIKEAKAKKNQNQVCVRVTRHWSDGTVSTLVGLGFVARYCLQ